MKVSIRFAALAALTLVSSTATAQTGALEQSSPYPGSGATVKRTSLVSMQPSVWMAVKRRVALAEKTCAVVVNTLVESRMAVPLRTLQPVEAIARKPAVATPCKGKTVESPS